MEEKLDPYKWVNKHRLEFLADGLFAIVITLLVLEIKVPVSESIHSDAELLGLLKTQLPKFASYIMSFIVLMMFWSVYVAQFNHIEKCDRRLFLINIFLLFSVSLIPFSTAFLSEHIDFKLSVFVYWLNLMLMGLSMAIQWNHVYKNELLKKPSAEYAEHNKIFMIRGKTAMPLYTVGALLCFVSNYLSIGFIFMVQLAFAFGLDQKLRMRRS